MIPPNRFHSATMNPMILRTRFERSIGMNICLECYIDVMMSDTSDQKADSWMKVWNKCSALGMSDWDSGTKAESGIERVEKFIDYLAGKKEQEGGLFEE